MEKHKMITSQNKIDALLKVGADALIDSTLSKLIIIQIAKYQNNIKQINSELIEFEKKFNMSTEECHKKFESGELGDNGDFFEWIGLYENVLLYKQRIEMLKSTI